MTDPPFRNHPSHLMPARNACRTHDFSQTPTEYFGWHVWVENRIKNGEKQECCKRCGNWLFPEEMNKAKDTPEKLFIDLVRIVEELIVERGLPPNIMAIFKRRTAALKKRSRVLKWR